ncbi:MAG: hypothetical protein P8X55_22030 [Desulfosarcinaceae bacterium]
MFLGRLPAEGQNLLNQKFGPFAPDQNLLQIVFQIAPLLRVIEGQLGKSDHGGQNIIEIVSDPAGQPTDSFHLPGLLQLVFKVFLFGDITDHHSDLHRGTVALFNDNAFQVCKKSVALLVSHAQSAGLWLFRIQKLPAA